MPADDPKQRRPDITLAMRRLDWRPTVPLREGLQKKDPDLIEVLDSRFTDLQKGLDRYKKGDGFVTYGELTPAQIKTLADEVNALGEPLSKLTAAVVL